MITLLISILSAYIQKLQYSFCFSKHKNSSVLDGCFEHLENIFDLLPTWVLLPEWLIVLV
jgi:hypothetical protein